MNHQIILNLKPSCVNISALAHSEDLLGTSNNVSSEWQLYTYFYIKDKKPYVKYNVYDKLFSDTLLFSTDSHEELEKWINEHREELQAQINKRVEKWIKDNKYFLDKYNSTTLEKIRRIIDIEVSGDAELEQVISCLGMIADFKKVNHYLPDDIAEWEDMVQFNYPQL